jgi:pyruvate carboxylase
VIRPKLGRSVSYNTVDNADLLAMQNNVPVVPGTPGPVADPNEADAFVEKYGFPVIIKVSLSLSWLKRRRQWEVEDEVCG